MMTLDMLEVPKAVATKKLDAVRRELNRRRKPIDDEISRLEKAYEAAAEGTPLIQLGQVIDAGGFFDNGLPHIAVARSDALRVTCHRGRGWLGGEWDTRERLLFNSFKRSQNPVFSTLSFPTFNQHIDRSGTTLVPLVPPEALDSAGVRRNMLRQYVTLFEVEEWRPVPPVDPALLKHIAGDLYAVLAMWDLTDLERAVIAGTR